MMCCAKSAHQSLIVRLCAIAGAFANQRRITNLPLISRRSVCLALVLLTEMHPSPGGHHYA